MDWSRFTKSPPSISATTQNYSYQIAISISYADIIDLFTDIGFVYQTDIDRYIHPSGTSLVVTQTYYYWVIIYPPTSYFYQPANQLFQQLCQLDLPTFPDISLINFVQYSDNSFVLHTSLSLEDTILLFAELPFIYQEELDYYLYLDVAIRFTVQLNYTAILVFMV